MRSAPVAAVHDSIAGALYALLIGDALSMPVSATVAHRICEDPHAGRFTGTTTLETLTKTLAPSKHIMRQNWFTLAVS